MLQPGPAARSEHNPSPGLARSQPQLRCSLPLQVWCVAILSEYHILTMALTNCRWSGAVSLLSVCLVLLSLLLAAASFTIYTCR